MCGIVGLLAEHIDTLGREAVVGGVLDAMRHRGPDNAGLWSDNNFPLTFGHRRLSIIDLASASHQPMSYLHERYFITYNGECYNYLDLRSELVSKGYSFRTNSDTEVIIAAFHEWGPSFVSKLDGMFAFAIYDRETKTLFLARDRAGEKPLYYAHVGSDFAFCSELKPLLKISWIDKTVDRSAVAEYLRYQYVPSPKTIVQGVKKLPPGCTLTLTNGVAREDKYWNPLDIAISNSSARENSTREEIESVIDQSVQSQMVADVNLGAFLSGGIDSTLVVSSMTKFIESSKIKTFTIGFKEDAFDESKFANQVAQVLKTDHQCQILSGTEAANSLPHILSFFSEPFADSSAIPTYFVSRLAREQVTVSLSGDGGDEVFGGYQRYSRLEKFNQLQSFPGTKLAAGLAPMVRNTKLKKILSSFNLPQELVYENMVSISSREIVSRLTGKSEWERFFGSVWDSSELSVRRKAMLGDYLTYLNGDILTKVDSASMAVSLESRAPLLSAQVYEAASRLSAPLIQDKKVLKDIVYSRVPREIMDRPKMGFGIPLGSWLRNELKELTSDSLLGQSVKISQFCDSQVMKTLVDEHNSGRSNHQSTLYSLISLSLWLDRNLA